jgi:hypothetical protein
MRIDPAIEAAQRVWEQQKSIPFNPQALWSTNSLIPTAREALGPIRELHKMIVDECGNVRCKTGGVHRVCAHDWDEWPCDTAKLIYSTEELES